jgi:predicted O-linked N-acetylglucosamine transferase (SPINDLY family)
MDSLEKIQKEVDQVKICYESKKYYEALKLSEELINKSIHMEYIFQVCSNIYFIFNNFKEALKYVNLSLIKNKNIDNYTNKIKILKKLNDKKFKEDIKVTINQIINLSNQYDESIVNYYIENCVSQIEKFDFVKNLYDRKIIDVKIFNIYLHYILSFTFLNELDQNFINLLKEHLSMEEIDDDIIINNIISITIPEYFILAIKYLTSPKIFCVSNEEININYQRSLKNLERLTEVLKDKIVYENPDIFYRYFINNYLYYYSYYGFNVKEFYMKFSNFFKMICKDFEYISPKLNNVKNTQLSILDNKIKIGFFSTFIFQNHSVCKDRIGIIKSLILDERFEVYLLSYKNEEEEIYKSIMKNINVNKILLPPSIVNSRKIIESLRLNIIVYPEIGMDIFFYILAHSKLAEIQINTWGHSETSGISTIDYYFSSSYFENELGQENYSEKLIKLDSLTTYYFNNNNLFDISEEIFKDKEKSLNEFNLPLNCHIYGILQNIFKLHYDNMKIIKNILINDPLSIVVFLCESNYKKYFYTYLCNTLGHLSNRVRIFEKMQFYHYLQLLSCVDIVLDSYPFGGCNTSIDSFYLNKIVITLPSNKLNGRFTQGFYKKMGIMEPIVSTADEFVEKSIWYMNNKEERIKIENKINENKYKLFNEEKSIEDWKYKLVELFSTHSSNIL